MKEEVVGRIKMEGSLFTRQCSVCDGGEGRNGAS